MPAETKVTKAEMNRRISTVYDLILIGSNRAQMIQYASEKTDWNVVDRQIDNYIHHANKRFAAHSEVHRAQEFGKALHRLNDLYQKSLKVQDYQRALSVQRELNALLGLYPPQALKITLEYGLTPDQINRIAAQLQQAGYTPGDALEQLVNELITAGAHTDSSANGS